MTVQLYEGCWGVTRGGAAHPQEVVEIGKEYDGRWTVKSLVAGCYIGQWFGDGSADMFVTAAKNSRFDIIAVFATEAEADAYLAGMIWQPIETCPEGLEVMTKIDDANGERNVQSLVQRTRVPGKTRPMFWAPDGSMYVYYTPTHWRHK